MAEVDTSVLVAGLERAWAQIRARHSQVPAAVLVIAAGSQGKRLKWGHFAAGRWNRADADCPEVLIGGEGLRRPAAEVLATLLHEAAHGLAHTRGVQDTSRQGRYHNRRYRALAQELGLEVAEVGTIGWSATRLPEDTADRYAEVLADLGGCLRLWRHAEPRHPAGRARNLLACACGCPRRIRVAPATLAVAPILCAACAQPFTPDDPLVIGA